MYSVFGLIIALSLGIQANINIPRDSILFHNPHEIESIRQENATR